MRLPTLLELFGNRGTIIGSPDLRPERGPSTDVGVVWAPAQRARRTVDRDPRRGERVRRRARATRSRSSSSVGFVARAMNVGDAQTYGAELVASARFARTLSLTANYTRLVTAAAHRRCRASTDKPLPREPGARALRARRCRRARSRSPRVACGSTRSWQSATLPRSGEPPDACRRACSSAPARASRSRRGVARVARGREPRRRARRAAAARSAAAPGSHPDADGARRRRRVSAARTQLLSVPRLESLMMTDDRSCSLLLLVAACGDNNKPRRAMVDGDDRRRGATARRARSSCRGDFTPGEPGVDVEARPRRR